MGDTRKDVAMAAVGMFVFAAVLIGVGLALGAVVLSAFGLMDEGVSTRVRLPGTMLIVAVLSLASLGGGLWFLFHAFKATFQAATGKVDKDDEDDDLKDPFAY